MSAEIVWLGEGEPSSDTRPRCRFCARVLTYAPLTPAEFPPHCTARGCRVCAECADGGTPLAPGYRTPRAAVAGDKP